VNLNLIFLVKRRIDEYLEFDSDILFRDKGCDYLEIFGGAVRDSIANLDIHDVDILSLSKSAKRCVDILTDNGYKFVPELNGKDVQTMYSEMHCIFEPWTFINKNLKIVQIIRPSNVYLNDKRSLIDNKLKAKIDPTVFFDLMKQVDLSCCGVSYDGNTIKENCEDAILHCQNRYYSVNETAKMYNKDRYIHRTTKLDDRGWTNISFLKDEQKINLDRFKKLESILND